MKTSLFLGTALTALLVTGIASAAKTTYLADLSGENEKPTPNDSAVTASARLTYDSDTKKLCGKVTFTPSNFTDRIKAAHIHSIDDADAGTGAPFIDLPTGAKANTINVTLTDSQVTKLEGTDPYVNYHTELHPAGEIRGTLVEDGDTDADPEECEGTPTADAGPITTPAADGGTSSTPTTTDEESGCNTTGGSTGSGLAMAAGLGLVITALSRRRKKA